MNDEFEIVSHEHINDFRLFLVNMLYRTPHIHKDFEICLLLDGEITLFSQKQSFQIKEGDFFVINPFHSHELKAAATTLILSLQVSPAFFKSYYPQIENLEFANMIFPYTSENSAQRDIAKDIIELAYLYLKKDDKYELKCVGMLNIIFYQLLRIASCNYISEKERTSYQLKQKRIRKITDYIDQNYARKLLLSDIAKHEGLTVCYLSHFFQECFHVSFHEYLMKIRCEKARQLLLLTDLSLFDISIACGFSDPKYFNKGFHEQYGYTPKEYRKQFIKEKLPIQQKSLLTTQEFLSDETSLIVLERHFNNE